MSNTGELTMDTEALHLPLPGLFADLDAGQGSISFNQDFVSQPGDVQLAVLEDWHKALLQERQRALVRLYHDICDPLGALPLPEKLDRFRAHCATLGVECPPDFAILLQQY